MLQSNKMKTESEIIKHSDLMSNVLILQKKIRLLRHSKLEANRRNQRHFLEFHNMKLKLQNLQQIDKYEMKARKEDYAKQLNVHQSGLEKCSAQYELVRASKNLIASHYQNAQSMKQELVKKIYIAAEEFRSLESLLSKR